MLKSIAFFVYPVSDMARARKFYEEALGLKMGMNFKLRSSCPPQTLSELF